MVSAANMSFVDMFVNILNTIGHGLYVAILYVIYRFSATFAIWLLAALTGSLPAARDWWFWFHPFARAFFLASAFWFRHSWFGDLLGCILLATISEMYFELKHENKVVRYGPQKARLGTRLSLRKESDNREGFDWRTGTVTVPVERAVPVNVHEHDARAQVPDRTAPVDLPDSRAQLPRRESISLHTRRRETQDRHTRRETPVVRPPSLSPDRPNVAVWRRVDPAAIELHRQQREAAGASDSRASRPAEPVEPAEEPRPVSTPVRAIGSAVSRALVAVQSNASSRLPNFVPASWKPSSGGEGRRGGKRAAEGTPEEKTGDRAGPDLHRSSPVPTHASAGGRASRKKRRDRGARDADDASHTNVSEHMHVDSSAEEEDDDMDVAHDGGSVGGAGAGKRAQQSDGSLALSKKKKSGEHSSTSPPPPHTHTHASTHAHRHASTHAGAIVTVHSPPQKGSKRPDDHNHDKRGEKSSHTGGSSGTSGSTHVNSDGEDRKRQRLTLRTTFPQMPVPPGLLHNRHVDGSKSTSTVPAGRRIPLRARRGSQWGDDMDEEVFRSVSNGRMAKKQVPAPQQLALPQPTPPAPFSFPVPSTIPTQPTQSTQSTTVLPVPTTTSNVGPGFQFTQPQQPPVDSTSVSSAASGGSFGGLFGASGSNVFAAPNTNPSANANPNANPSAGSSQPTGNFNFAPSGTLPVAQPPASTRTATSGGTFDFNFNMPSTTHPNPTNSGTAADSKSLNTSSTGPVTGVLFGANPPGSFFPQNVPQNVPQAPATSSAAQSGGSTVTHGTGSLPVPTSTSTSMTAPGLQQQPNSTAAPGGFSFASLMHPANTTTHTSTSSANTLANTHAHASTPQSTAVVSKDNTVNSLAKPATSTTGAFGFGAFPPVPSTQQPSITFGSSVTDTSKNTNSTGAGMGVNNGSSMFASGASSSAKKGVQFDVPPAAGRRRPAALTPKPPTSSGTTFGSTSTSAPGATNPTTSSSSGQSPFAFGTNKQVGQQSGFSFNNTQVSQANANPPTSTSAPVPFATSSSSSTSTSHLGNVTKGASSSGLTGFGQLSANTQGAHALALAPTQTGQQRGLLGTQISQPGAVSTMGSGTMGGAKGSAFGSNTQVGQQSGFGNANSGAAKGGGFSGGFASTSGTAASSIQAPGTGTSTFGLPTPAINVGSAPHTQTGQPTNNKSNIGGSLAFGGTNPPTSNPAPLSAGKLTSATPTFSFQKPNAPTQSTVVNTHTHTSTSASDNTKNAGGSGAQQSSSIPAFDFGAKANNGAPGGTLQPQGVGGFSGGSQPGNALQSSSTPAFGGSSASSTTTFGAKNNQGFGGFSASSQPAQGQGLNSNPSASSQPGNALQSTPAFGGKNNNGAPGATLQPQAFGGFSASSQPGNALQSTTPAFDFGAKTNNAAPGGTLQSQTFGGASASSTTPFGAKNKNGAPLQGQGHGGASANPQPAQGQGFSVPTALVPCKYYALGTCSKGSECHFSHAGVSGAGLPVRGPGQGGANSKFTPQSAYNNNQSEHNNHTQQGGTATSFGAPGGNFGKSTGFPSTAISSAAPGGGAGAVNFAFGTSPQQPANANTSTPFSMNVPTNANSSGAPFGLNPTSFGAQGGGGSTANDTSGTVPGPFSLGSGATTSTRTPGSATKRRPTRGRGR